MSFKPTSTRTLKRKPGLGSKWFNPTNQKFPTEERGETLGYKMNAEKWFDIARKWSLRILPWSQRRRRRTSRESTEFSKNVVLSGHYINLKAFKRRNTQSASPKWCMTGRSHTTPITRFAIRGSIHSMRYDVRYDVSHERRCFKKLRRNCFLSHRLWNNEIKKCLSKKITKLPYFHSFSPCYREVRPFWLPRGWQERRRSCSSRKEAGPRALWRRSAHSCYPERPWG